VEKLIQLALDGGGNDNVTAVVLKVQESPFSKTSYALPKQQFKPIEDTINHTSASATKPGVLDLLKSPKIKAMLVVILLLLAGIIYMNITSKKGNKKSKDQNQVSGTTENGDDQEEDDGGFFGSIMDAVTGNNNKPDNSEKNNSDENKVNNKKKEQSVDKEDSLNKSNPIKSGDIKKSNDDSLDNSSKQVEIKIEIGSNETKNNTTVNNTKTKDNQPAKTVKMLSPFKDGKGEKAWKKACDYIVTYRGDLKGKLTVQSLLMMNKKTVNDSVKVGDVLIVIK
jgi:hypothetical protein